MAIFGHSEGIAEEPNAFVADAAGYQKTVAPFLTKYCQKCHAGDKPQADFAVDLKRLPIDFAQATARAPWREVVNVLNSHEMPPEKEKHPKPDEVTAVVDWITQQTVRAELAGRERSVVLRRLNREEYRNTIRDLIGVDFDTSGFPQDPPAGGFDNNGGALTMSPLHVEMYLAAAQQILDRAIVEGDRPAAVKWRFEPKVGPADRTRLRLDPHNNPLVNGGNNVQDGPWVVVHHSSWDTNVGARDFRVPTAGRYAIRVHAAGRVPKRDAVVASAEKILKHRQNEQDEKNPKGKQWTQRQFEEDLKHFQTDRMYDYGPPRIKLVLQLGPLPKTVAEFDIGGTPDKPSVHETIARFTTESAGVSFEYAYAIPRVLENFWMQGHATFARPEMMIDWFEVEGPLYDAWPPASHTRLLFDSPLRKSDETKYAREVIAKFMRRAYRRPVDGAEIDARLKLYTAARKEKSFLESIKLPLIAVLSSPHFLYLAEPLPGETPTVAAAGSGAKPASTKPGSAGTAPRPAAKGGSASTAAKPSASKTTSNTPLVPATARLNDHQLASRLSYFLWSTMPDDELSKLADDGKIRDAKVRAAQVDRMLADPKSDALVKNFAGQWLGLRDVGANPPATDLYPQYDRHLETSIVGESEAYFKEFLQSGRDTRQMIRSDFVTINERLARYYGIPEVRGDEFRVVPVPKGVQRGGIVTQASILTTTSNGTRTSPVKRGTWVLKTLMGIDPGFPVANAGEIAPKVPGIDKATVRQRLEIHRELPQCARCHSKIDPLGFALENYNAAGEWRDREGFGYKGRISANDPMIDNSSKMPDGTSIQGVAGLQEAMLAKEDLFLGALASKLMTYAIGRELGLADQPTVKTAIAETKKGKYALKGLVKFIVSSEPFETR
jgi:hypothetical protein